MAMLAEPKKKTKYSINPRGTAWSNDDAKFGNKIMEKMGWNKGKGLGANEDGQVDHITVGQKKDTLGVGCTKSQADNWIAHQDGFNDLLANLNASHNEGATGSVQNGAATTMQSLEEKSKSAKGRLHYQKFARGKDLSSRNEVDLDCIFGRRKSRSAPATPVVQSEVNSGANSETENVPDEGKDDKEHGVATFTKGTSVQAYFAQKMAELKRARENPQSSGDAPSNLSEEVKQETEVSQSPGDAECEKSLDNSDDGEKSKKGKKRKRKERETAEKVGGNGVDVDIVSTGIVGVENDTNIDDEKPRKTKNKRKEKLSEEEMPKCDTLEECEEPSKKKSKKNKKKMKEAKEEVGNVEEMVNQPEVKNPEIKTTKTNKNNKKRKGVEEDEVGNVDKVASQPEVKNPVEIKATKTNNNNKGNVTGTKAGVQEQSSGTKKNKKRKKGRHTVVGASSSSAVEVDEREEGGERPASKKTKKRELGFKGSNLGEIKGYGTGLQKRH